MKNAKINNKNLVATSIAAAILAITGSTSVIGATAVTDATTAAPNRVNDGELMLAQCWPFWPFWCRSNNYNQENFDGQNDSSVAIASSNSLTLI